MFFKALLSWVAAVVGVVVSPTAGRPMVRLLPAVDPGSTDPRAWRTSFAFVNNAFIGALTVLDNCQATYAKAAGASLAVNLGLNLILIPPFGYIAASWTTVATEMVLVAAGWWLTAGHLGILLPAAASWRPILAGVVMGAVLVSAWNVSGERCCWSFCSGSPCYGAAVFLLRAMTREEIQFLRSALLRRQS